MTDTGRSTFTYEESRKALGDALTELKRQAGSPSIDRVIARGKNKMPGSSEMSKGTISEVLNGKRAPQSLDRLLWLVRALMAFEDGAEVEPPGATDSRIQRWRDLWRMVEDARAVGRRPPSPKAAPGSSRSDDPQTGVPLRRPPQGVSEAESAADTASVSSGQKAASVQALPPQPVGSLAVQAAIGALQQGLEVRLPALQAGQQVCSVAFSPDGRLLASGSGDGWVRVWDPVGRRQLDEPPEATGAPVSSVAFSPDGRWLASGSVDGNVRVWRPPGKDRRARELPWLREQTDEPLTCVGAGSCSVAFSPDGKLLAVGSGDGVVQLWNLSAPYQIGHERTAFRAKACSVAFSPDGKLLAVEYGDGSVQLREPTGHARYEISADLLASRNAGKARRQHGIMKRAFLGARPSAEEPRAGVGAGAVAFSPDGSLLATASGDGILRLWDPAGRQEIRGPVGMFPVVAMAFSPDGSLLATASGDGMVRLWDPATNKNVHELRSASGEALLAVAFSPDGSLLATGGADSIELWTIPPQRGVLRLTAVKTST
ncbi:WD40 repeat domain-containing protein [Streptomyces scabiei]|uniref:WD40 repeat domain-containing protein n=1 Tax=Streptomyces scabiei TaxID=1930 RepID=UPI000AC85291|nr:WD40 repeat domain-containing protein [Streptomyces scabiei]